MCVVAVLEISVVAELVKTFGAKVLTSSATTELDCYFQEDP